MDSKDTLRGFGNHIYSEAIKNALPLTQNSPQKPPLGLYAEQLSGTAFTSPRAQNKKTWCYRLYPSVIHQAFSPISHPHLTDVNLIPNPNQIRFKAFELSEAKLDFIDSLITIAGHNTASIYLFLLNKTMDSRYFYNADGDLLIAPYAGEMTLFTEFGELLLKPNEIAVIPRGIVFKVISNHALGYICENKGAPFILPELGPIGANGLANPLDFIHPNAKFEELSGDFTLVCKYHNRLWQASIAHSPLNVVAFKGNYLPYKYDLRLFNTINTVSFDHPDPSIFTVLTSPSSIPGTANIDFVIFSDRWMVAENTFRPPYFHRNIMSEFMGLIKGQYDAKGDEFQVGGFSIHNQMSAHGPDTQSYIQGTNESLIPHKYTNTLAFMFESNHAWHLNEKLYNHPKRDNSYHLCWQELSRHRKT